MQATYKILGGDGQEYGPATLDQMLGWVREGRVNATTQVWRSDQSAWMNANQLPELQFPPQPLSAPPVGGLMTADRQHLEARVRSGASWFYWIAALSLINSIATLSGSGWGFIVGLGIMKMVDAFAHSFAIAVTLDVLIAGVFVLFGVFAHKRQTWAFAIGMILYALDGVIFAMARDWLAAGFHAFVLYSLVGGFRATRRLTASV